MGSTEDTGNAQLDRAQDGLSGATDAVLKPSDPVPSSALPVSGIDFNHYGPSNPLTVESLVSSLASTGFQATAVSQAVDIINEMRSWRGQAPRPEEEAKIDHSKTSLVLSPDPTPQRTTIFLGYTSNLISSGLRPIIRYLVQHEHVHCLVTTAGGLEEDLIKCLGKTYLSPEGFSADGATLRSKGMNRIGNLLVPNDNYCRFEDWLMPILDAMFAEQEAGAVAADGGWTPSTVMARLGREINDEESVCYWAWKNDIPIFCPALTDGSLGDMLYFHTFRTASLSAPFPAAASHLNLNITPDIRRLNTMAVRAARTGMIILGGGVVKHHICNANLMRNGAEYAVFVNTGQEFDGSDAGARPDEAVSWGKIAVGARSVKVYADASIVFPLIVAATFAKDGVQPSGEDVERQKVWTSP